MKLDITKSQNGGYIVNDIKSKAISVVAACVDEADRSAQDQQHLDLGNVIAALVEDWYAKGQDKIVTMDDGEDGEEDAGDDEVVAGDFITAIGNELVKFAKRVPSRHKREAAKSKEESG